MAHSGIFKILPRMIVIVAATFVTAQTLADSERPRSRAECEQKAEALAIKKYSERSLLLQQLKSEIDNEKDEEKIRVLKEKEKKETDRIQTRAKEDAIDVCAGNSN
jgi:biopolymer transport protein ExbD